MTTSLGRPINGINVRTTINGVTNSAFAGNNVKNNSAFLSIGESYSVTVNEMCLQVRMKFNEDFLSPIQLFGNSNDRLSVILHDNFTGLVFQSFSVSGSKQV